MSREHDDEGAAARPPRAVRHHPAPSVDAAVQGVMESCHSSAAPEVKRVEQEVARYSQTAHAVACASGTDAILLAPGRSASAPATKSSARRTFFATAGTIANNGATPVFVDVDPKTYNMDTHLLEAAITPRTKAVVAVSLFGQCCDMPTIKAICDKHQLFLIEDAAQSIGSGGGQALRLDERLRHVLVLPVEEPRRRGRRRHDRDAERRAGREGPPALQTTARSRSTTTRSSARTRASTRSRPRSCA